MIVAFSTSSPRTGVWIFDPDTKASWSQGEQAQHAAGGACLRMLQLGLHELGREIQAVHLFLADLGPGSFTGTRVGVTLAKTLAYAVGAKAGGANAFDLVDPHGRVALPSKRGEWFVRDPGEEPYRTSDVPPAPFRGYGNGVSPPEQQYPSPNEFVSILDSIQVGEPELLVPHYLVGPSISIPKKPYGGLHSR